MTVSGTVVEYCLPDSPVVVAIGEDDGRMPWADGSVRGSVIGNTDAVNSQFSLVVEIPATIGKDPSGVAVPTAVGPTSLFINCYNPSISTYPIQFDDPIPFTITEGSAPEPSVTVDATSVAAGGALSFQAIGFAPDSEVSVELHSDRRHRETGTPPAPCRARGTRGSDRRKAKLRGLIRTCRSRVGQQGIASPSARHLAEGDVA